MVGIVVVDFHLCVSDVGVVSDVVKYGESQFCVSYNLLCIGSTAAAMYGSIYESNYMISILINSWNIKDNYITKCRVNAGCTEVLTWSCVEVMHMVVRLQLWSVLLLGLSVHAY